MVNGCRVPNHLFVKPHPYQPIPKHRVEAMHVPNKARITLKPPSAGPHLLRSHVVYNVAAVSTTPAALKAFLFVHRMSTLCTHSMYRDQPRKNFISDLIHRRRRSHRGPTPVCKLPAKVLAHPRDDQHGQDELQLLKTALPLCLSIRVGCVRVDVACGYRWERVEIILVLHDGRIMEVDEGFGGGHVGGCGPR